MQNARAIFETIIPRRLAAAPRAARSLDFVCAFDLTGPGGGKWTVDLTADPPACTAGESPAAGCKVSCPAELFGKVFGDLELATKLYYEQQLTIAGDLSIAVRFLAFFSAEVDGDEGLSALLRPFPVKEFLAKHWPGEALAVHGPRERLGAFAKLPELADLPTLFRTWPGQVGVFPKSGDDFDAPAVFADQAEKLFSMGHPVFFAAAHAYFTSLAPWLSVFREELGIAPNANSRCIAYGTPKGYGARMHYDANANFVVQLQGVKVWQLAPNPSVTNPNHRWATSFTEIPAPLRRYMTAPFPHEMPKEGLQTVTLREGSVLFVPRGWWHSTVAEEDALSLNFTYSSPDWISLLVSTIRTRLEKHAHWRELALGAGCADPAMAAYPRERMRELLAGLQADLGHIEPEDVVGVVERAPRTVVTEFRPKDWVKLLGRA